MQTTAEVIERSGLTEIERRVLDRITEKAWLDLTCELVPAGQPEAENPLDPDEAPAREEGAAIFIAGKLQEMGFTVTFPTKREGRPNVVGILEGAGDGPSLILNDHLDTYPAGDWNAWTMTGGHPFRPTRHGDKLYARGTSDTRGNLACTLLAARAIREAGVKLRGTLKCVYTADEEKNGPDGSIFLLDECGLDADYTIVCEPTGWTKPDGTMGHGHCGRQRRQLPGRDRNPRRQDAHLAARHRDQRRRQDGAAAHGSGDDDVHRIRPRELRAARGRWRRWSGCRVA